MFNVVLLGIVAAAGIETNSAPHLRTRASAEVSPAPIPTGLPLVRLGGEDGFGAPRSYVDSGALRSLLMARRFAELTRHLERFQEEFERHARKEPWIHRAVESLGAPDSATKAALDEWANAVPSSFAPYAARGVYWLRLAIQRRGAATAPETRRDEFAAMDDALRRAVEDLDRALALRPRLAPALSFRVEALMFAGDRAGCVETFERARATCEACFFPRSKFLTALSPRWFGSLAAMERLVDASPASLNPAFARLRGRVHGERLDALWRAGRYEEALREADLGVEAGAGADLLLARATLAANTRGRQVARADLFAAVAAEPWHLGARARRAEAMAEEGRWEEAGRDVLFILRVTPSHEKGGAALSRVVLGLAREGTALAERGKRERARRLLSLAADLNPADPDLAARVESLSGRRRPKNPRPPRPAEGPFLVTGTVVDSDDRPMAGLRVFHVAAYDPADTMRAHALDGASGAAVTDAEGRFSISAPGGPRLFVATRADAARAAVGLHVAEGNQGPLRIAFGGESELQGRVDGKGGVPIAGVQVRAFLDEPGRAGEVHVSFGIGVSDSQGRFRIGGLAPGRYRVYAKGNGYASEESFGDGERIALGGGLAVLKVEPAALIRGRVLRPMPSGPAVPLTSFRIRTPQTSLAFEPDDGRFEVPFLRSWAGLPFVVESLGLAPIALRFATTAGIAVELGDLTLDRGRAVRGRVLTDAGGAVEGGVVRVGTSALLLDSPSARTGADGRFTLEWLSGEAAALHVQRDGLRTREASGSPGGPELLVRLDTGRSVAFHVEDLDGAPLQGVGVSVIGRGSTGSCFSGPNGTCTVAGLGPDGFAAEVGRVPGDSGPRPLPRQIHVPAGFEPAPDVTIRYPRSRSVVVVRMLSAKGTPTGATLDLVPGTVEPSHLFDDGGRVAVPHFRHGYGERFEIDDVPSGRYTAVARGGLCSVTSLEVVEGATRELDLTLTEPCPGAKSAPGAARP